MNVQTPQVGADRSIERAMAAVFKGPELKKLKVHGHEFNVKPAAIVRSKNKVTANGQISHHLARRPDDQVYYTIAKEGNEVKDMQVRVAPGGGTQLLAPLVSAVAAFIGKPVPREKIEEAGGWLGRQIDGNWRTVAQVLVANVALRL